MRQCNQCLWHSQAVAIPHLVRRYDKEKKCEVPARDIIIQDMTGSGKTLVFVLPILSAVDVYTDDLQAVIVVPTRELAVQVATVAHQYGTIGGSKKRKQNPVRVQAVVGEHSPAMDLALDETKPHVVVTTPQIISVGRQQNACSDGRGREQEAVKCRGLSSCTTLRSVMFAYV